MANEAKSKDFFRVVLPRDVENYTREGDADVDSEFRPGTLVCRRDGYLRACDLSDPTHGEFYEYAPVEIVWTDGKNRVDITRIDLDGSEHKQLTTFTFDCIAEIDESIIDLTDSTPTNIEAPQYLLRGNEGKMRVASLADLDAEAPNADESPQHLVVGQIVEAGEEEGKFFARFKLA